MTQTSSTGSCENDPGPRDLPPLPPKWSAPLTEQPTEHRHPNYSIGIPPRCPDCGELSEQPIPPSIPYAPGGVTVLATAEELEHAKRQADIAQAELGRTAALLQVCRWATVEGNTIGTSDYDGDEPELIQLIVGIQHDYIPDHAGQTQAHGRALLVLARRWHELPVNERTVVESALVPANHLGEWRRLRPTLSTGAASSLRLEQLAENFSREVLGL